MGAGDGSSGWRSSGCRSTGATMSVTPHRAAPAPASISIYVNNNVQGVTNSVLVGSRVVMRDPGARVVIPARRPRRAGRLGFRNRKQQKLKTKMAAAAAAMWAAAAAAAMVCLAIAVVMLGAKCR